MAFYLQKQGSTILLGVLVLAAGCGEKSPGDDEGSETTAVASSGGVSASDTGAPSTGDVASTTSEASSGSATGTSTGEATSTGVATSTTGEPVCSLEDVACKEAERLGPVMDCGLVDPWNDTVEAWQAAHDCALAAATAEQPFKLITILQGIDSDVGAAYVGVAARSYALTTFFFDGDPCGGGGCGPVVSASSCAGLVATLGCTVEPGSVCLTCEEQGAAAQVCGPE